MGMLIRRRTRLELVRINVNGVDLPDKAWFWASDILPFLAVDLSLRSEMEDIGSRLRRGCNQLCAQTMRTTERSRHEPRHLGPKYDAGTASTFDSVMCAVVVRG